MEFFNKSWQQMKRDVPWTSPTLHVIKNYLHVYDLL